MKIKNTLNKEDMKMSIGENFSFNQIKRVIRKNILTKISIQNRVNKNTKNVFRKRKNNSREY